MADNTDKEALSKAITLKKRMNVKQKNRYFQPETTQSGAATAQHEHTASTARERRVVGDKHRKDRLRPDSHTHNNKKQGTRGRYMYNAEKEDPFPGPAPVSEVKINTYKRGKSMPKKARTKFYSDLFEKKEAKFTDAEKQAARAELLLSEQPGFLELGEDEDVRSITQHDIRDAVDITSAQKYFELDLPHFGPYRMNYTRNGRCLLLAGHKGHIAALDWQTKKLMCEINVMETVNDCKWLHQETFFAVAQKRYTYIYDNQGIEIHCLKAPEETLRMEFLPYHFLLASASARGYLYYLDVSIGKKVAGYSTGLGRLHVMCQNPSNAVICTGHVGGGVSMWTPSSGKPVVKLLCHKANVHSVAVNKDGRYMATSSSDSTMRIWDLRTYKMLQAYRMKRGAGQLAFSQTDLLTAGMGNVVEIYRDCCQRTVTTPYLTHVCRRPVHSLNFCPYEDVLGVGHGDGFASLIVPGAGEANFDALEANPFQTKQQRKHAEVRMLLDKVPPEMIHMDAQSISQVDIKKLTTETKNKASLLVCKPDKVVFQPRNKQRGRSKAGKFEERKHGVKEERQRKQIKNFITKKLKDVNKQTDDDSSNVSKSANVLDRFRRNDP